VDKKEDPIKEDFRNLLFLAWKHLDLPAPTPLQYDIATYLQHGPRRKVIQAFRGCGKSWITAIYCLWLLYRDPNERILVISASSDRAKAFTIFTRRLIGEMEVLRHLIPTKDQRDSAISFDVGPSNAHQAPSVRSVGITGQLTGGRASHIILDDVEVPRNSLTQSMRDNLSNAVKEADAVLTPNGSVSYLGTPQTEMSLYNALPKRGYELRVWTSRYPTPEAQLSELYMSRLAPYLKEKLVEEPELASGFSGRGAPVEPTRFDDVDLCEREASYGRSGFQMQFQLVTQFSDQDKHPLKISDFIVMGLDKGELGPVQVAWGSGKSEIINDIDCVGLDGDKLHRPIFVSTDFAKYQGTVLAIDPAGRGADELSYAVVSMLNGFLYVRACEGLQNGYCDANLQKLADTAKTYGATEIYVEKTFGDGMFSKLLTPFVNKTYPCHIEEMNSNQQKELRIIDTLEPVMQGHKLIIAESVVKRDQINYNGYSEDSQHQYQLLYQLSRITRDRRSLKHDDRLDALSMGVSRWVEQMDRDTDKAEADHKGRLLDAELRKFKTQVLGHKHVSPNWTKPW
jgi:hypothetical protein